METMKIKTVDENMQMRIIASVAFEANRQYCEMIGGKPFNPSWAETTQEARDTLVEAVKVALTDRIVSAELSHLRWATVQIEQGWSAGPRFDPCRKTDPNLVGFRELSLQQQLKDILFLAIANSLGAALGYREFDDEDLSEESIQEHQETVAGLETAVTGKTDLAALGSKFVPAGEGDGEPVKDLRKDEINELGTDAEDSSEKENIDTPAGEGPENPDKQPHGLPEVENTDTTQPPESDRVPDEQIAEVQGEENKLRVEEESFNETLPDNMGPEDEFSARSADFEKDRTAEPTQAPAPPDEDPVDHAPTKPKKGSEGDKTKKKK